MNCENPAKRNLNLLYRKSAQKNVVSTQRWVPAELVGTTHWVCSDM